MLTGKKTLVVGIGKTGLATAKFLKTCGASVTATDVKSEKDLTGTDELKRCGIAVETGGHNLKSFASADLIVVSPGVDSRLEFLKEAREKGIEVISDIELFSKLTHSTIFAVTGTNGKSTTTELLYRILCNSDNRVFLGGNIGTPAIEYFASREGYEMAVLEISSFHLENISKFAPHVAVLLNITEDHLYRYEDFSDYARTKFKIFSNQTPDDYAVVNAGDPIIKEAMKRWRFKSKLIPFTTSDILKEPAWEPPSSDVGRSGSGLYLKGQTIVMSHNNRQETYPLEGVKLIGIHNIENMMAVIASSVIAGVKKDIIISAIREFKGLPHRMEFVRELKGVSYINDSKSTNIGSLHKALEGITNGHSVVLIAGGVDKGGDYGALKDIVKDKVGLLILIGEARDRIKKALCHIVETVYADNIEEAIRIASTRAISKKGGSTVLLSPACSSFDMFKNFEDRGEAFKSLVEKL